VVARILVEVFWKTFLVKDQWLETEVTGANALAEIRFSIYERSHFFHLDRYSLIIDILLFHVMLSFPDY
jgi:hypothetical protein